MSEKFGVGVIGSGTMGSGIAQIAAQAGHAVTIIDTNDEALEKAKQGHQKIMARLVEKGRISQQEKDDILNRIEYHLGLNEVCDCQLIVEAIVENPEIKRNLFSELENIVSKNTILASNTSSLSIASIASGCSHPERFLGLHFFNPAPLLPLVEVVPSLLTNESYTKQAFELMKAWKKQPVIAKDTPGFIVNRVARPFYGESLRMVEEGIADFATVDWALKEFGGFRMGPFELMDLIGNDVNYTVTETVFKEFYYDPRYKPSFTQKRMKEAGLLGRKSGRGYFDYREGATRIEPKKDEELGKRIFWRVLVMLINEAADALYLNIATKEDIDLAMTKGVNYPKGLLAWADEVGIEEVLDTLEHLQHMYGEDRYRPSFLLRKMVEEGKTFY